MMPNPQEDESLGQEDESLGTEQLPQTELDAIPGVGEPPALDNEDDNDARDRARKAAQHANANRQDDRSQGQ